MPIKKRTYNTRRIKRDYSYELAEIAELFDLHISSIRNWIKAGLPLIDNGRPQLVHGSDLIAFLNVRQKKRKRPCKPFEGYCLKCRAPRAFWKSAVDVIIKTPARLQITGLCAECNTAIFKAGSVKKIPEYAKTFDIQTVQGRRIIERSHPTLMCHFKEASKDG